MNYLENDFQILAEEISRLGLKDSSVLITGATGLIGSLLVKSFLKANEEFNCGITVKAVCRSREKSKRVFGTLDARKDMQVIEQDVTTPFGTDAQADYIIHTASPTTSRYFMSNPVEVVDAICTGSKNVLELAKACQAKGVVYLSSMEVFGVVEGSAKISEKQLGYIDIGNIRSCYSEGKRLVECLCKCYAAEYEVPVKIARLAQVFGAGVSKDENRVFAQFARSAVAGTDIILHTTGESVGNYCYSRDAVKAILLLLTKGEKGEAYTIVNEASTMTIAEMAELVAEQFSGGRSNVVFDIPEGNEFGYAPVTKMRLDGSKMRKLGWKPEVGMVEAYQRMIPDLLGGGLL